MPGEEVDAVEGRLVEGDKRANFFLVAVWVEIVWARGKQSGQKWKQSGQEWKQTGKEQQQVPICMKGERHERGNG